VETERIILKWHLKKYGWKMLAGVIHVRIGKSDALF